MGEVRSRLAIGCDVPVTMVDENFVRRVWDGRAGTYMIAWRIVHCANSTQKERSGQTVCAGNVSGIARQAEVDRGNSD
jgi:hypothetical protein